MQLPNGNPPSSGLSFPKACPYDKAAIQKHLESTFVTRIPEDDGLWMTLAGVEAVINKAWETTSLSLADVLNSRLSEFNQGVESVQKTMDASAAEKLKLLNEEFMRSARNAIEAVNRGKNEANQYLITALVEMRQLLDEIKRSHRGNAWKERFFGIILAGGLVVGGFLMGLVWKGVR